MPYQTLAQRRSVSRRDAEALVRAVRAAEASIGRAEESLATARSNLQAARLAVYDAVGGTEAARLLGISRQALYASIRQAP